MLTLLLTSFTHASPPSDVPLPVDGTFSVLKGETPRERLTLAATLLADWRFDLAGIEVDGPLLAGIASSDDPSLTRAARETLRRPVDVDDLLYLLDDILAAEDRRGEAFHVHSGRARNVGVLVHPDEIFKSRPRNYPDDASTLAVDVPRPQATIDVPAADADPPGPAWTARYQNPSEREPMLTALAAERPDDDFAARIAKLLTDLEAEGVEVYLASTTRSRERGYLMWGAFLLSRAKSAAELNRSLTLLDKRNKEWGLNVPITWRVPGEWTATVEAATSMKETYDVVYATEGGAKNSNHYGGMAADLIGLALPRRLTLTAPDGATRSFLLAGDDETRDLSLTPRLITWIETHYGLVKLNSDYPHWSDAEKP